MSADLLRQAADKLEALAEAATPGPWEFDAEDMDPGVWSSHGERGHWVVGEWQALERDAAYIATMSPPVANALAVWLRDCAAFHDKGLLGIRHERHALAVARAVLGVTA